MTLRDQLEGPTTESYFASIQISQGYKDLLLWEKFFSGFEPHSCLELGTWQGGMAVFLSLQAHARNISFVTCDKQECHSRACAIVEHLGGKLLIEDIFSLEGEQHIREAISSLPKPIVLFCDNGNKRREFALFTPHLASGDFVAVHDWGSEFHAPDVVGDVEMIMQSECEELDSITRFFKVK